MVMMRTGFFKMSSGTARLYQPVELKSYVEPWEGSRSEEHTSELQSR